MKRPTLIRDWKRVLRRAWSVKLALASSAFGAIELLLPQFTDVIPRHTFAVLSIAVGVLAAIFRLLAQQELQNDAGQQ